MTIKKTALLLTMTVLASCSDPVGPTDDIGAITGYVIIGSVPTANVEVTLDDGTVRSTNNAGQYRFVNLTVGDSHVVTVMADAVPEGVEMHLSERQVTVPETHVAYANFYGSRAGG